MSRITRILFMTLLLAGIGLGAHADVTLNGIGTNTATGKQQSSWPADGTTTTTLRGFLIYTKGVTLDTEASNWGTANTIWKSSVDGLIYLGTLHFGQFAYTFPLGIINEGSIRSASGNARGTGAMDFQLSRASASQVASGNYALLFGQSGTASGNYSVALGRRAAATHDGSFVFKDSVDSAGTSAATNSMNLWFANGLYLNGIRIDSGSVISDTTGVDLTTSGTKALTAATADSIITEVLIIPTTVTAMTVNPNVSIGITGSDGAIMTDVQLVGISTTRPWKCSASIGTVQAVSSGAALNLVVSTPATATACTARVILFGRII